MLLFFYNFVTVCQLVYCLFVALFEGFQGVERVVQMTATTISKLSNTLDYTKHTNTHTATLQSDSPEAQDSFIVQVYVKDHLLFHMNYIKYKYRLISKLS